MANVLLTGGTGLIGTQLQQHLIDKGYSITVLIRGKEKNKSSNPNTSYANWNVANGEIDKDAIASADYIIHLAGANVAEKRWTNKRKKEIVESRTKSGELLVKSLKEIPNKVKAVVSASAIGWYGKDNDQSKQNGFREGEPAANDFLGNTCKLWEASIQPVAQLNKRLAIFRFGIVLSKKGGALAAFKMPLKFFIAGILGNGKQTISWVHIDDLCKLLIYAIEHENISGVFNAVAPECISNKELSLTLAQQMHDKFYLPLHVPSFLLKLLMGEMSTEVLKSTTVNDDKIKNAGFDFHYPAIKTALKNLG